jgi:enoyl-CoA hydratase/carnithine racemase
LTLELAYTNDIIDAKEMERVGLVNRVVPHDQLMSSARNMALKMFDIPPLGLALAKRCVYKALEAPDLETQINYEMLTGKTLGQTEDRTEAVRSFMEKRKPVYHGK